MANYISSHTGAQIDAFDTAIQGKVSKSGDTMTGDLTIDGDTPSIFMKGGNVYLDTNDSDSNDSGDLVWRYGNGQEKARLWCMDTYTEKYGPSFRVYKEDGTQLFSGSLSL